MAANDETIRTELGPGMESIIYAPDTLVITDKEGQEFAVTARNNEETTDFLKAFDEWFMVKQRGGFSDGIVAVLWSEVERTYRALPLSIQRDLPSFKQLGVSVPGHKH